MNPWLAFIIGLVAGGTLGVYGLSVLITAAVRSQGPGFSSEVEERLEAQREAGRQGLN